MTQTLDSSPVHEPSPRRRRWWPSVLLTLLSLLLLLIGVGHSTYSHECCAIDCGSYPEACERRAREHHHAETTAGRTAFAGFVGSAIALGTAVVLLRGR
ncbi:MAG TPA: hypothetical protein VF006_34440 [Longimicrobium sp.]